MTHSDYKEKAMLSPLSIKITGGAYHRELLESPHIDGLVATFYFVVSKVFEHHELLTSNSIAG
jgi:hypothetical protein